MTNGAGVNASSVADHAMALLLALVRDIPHCAAPLRRGEWPRSARPSLAGKRRGVLGLGAVGLAIAQPAAMGVAMSFRYRNPRVPNDGHYPLCAPTTDHARVQDPP